MVITDSVRSSGDAKATGWNTVIQDVQKSADTTLIKWPNRTWPMTGQSRMRCVLTWLQRRTPHHLCSSPPQMFKLSPSMRPTQMEGALCQPTGLDSSKMSMSWKIFKKLANCFTSNKTKETWEPNAMSNSETDPDLGKKAKQVYEGHYWDHWGNLKINHII